MNVKELKELLAPIPDDAIVVTHGSEHYSREVSMGMNTALHDVELDILSEDLGEELTPEAECGRRINVFVVY